jgi:hypothetical protein
MASKGYDGGHGRFEVRDARTSASGYLCLTP